MLILFVVLQPLIDRVLRYPELSSRYVPPDTEKECVAVKAPDTAAQPETVEADTMNGEHRQQVPLPPSAKEKTGHSGTESEEDMFESFVGPSVTLSPLVGMLMQRMAEERSPLIEQREEVKRVFSIEHPERPKTPSPTGYDDEDGPLSPFVGSLLGKSFHTEEMEKEQEDEVATCQKEQAVMAMDFSVPPVLSEGTKVTAREKKDRPVDSSGVRH